MLERFQKFIIEKELFTHHDKILVALSGGVDSVVLCDLLYKLNYTFAIVHCNFQLRGEEAALDKEFALGLAEEYKVDCYYEDFFTKEYAEDHGISLQMAARELRYRFFYNTIDLIGYDLIATAHHQNDNIETVLLNLTRGTGIAGIRGIPVKSNKLVRPLFFASKDAIIGYATAAHLRWREDSSNATDKYKRNFLRHKVVPLLKELNNNLEETFYETSARLEQVELVFQKEAEIFKRSAVRVADDKITIDIKILSTFQGNIALLLETIKEYGFKWADAKMIVNGLDAISGKKYESEKYLLVKDRTHLVITPKETLGDHMEVMIAQEDAEAYHPFFMVQLSKADNQPLYNFFQKDTLSFDFHQLTFPLLIRRWEEGDSFQPMGMKGRKKISDFLIDKKVPLNLKNKIYVITSEDKVIGIAGFTIDEKYKIIPSTKTIYRMEWKWF